MQQPFLKKHDFCHEFVRGSLFNDGFKRLPFFPPLPFFPRTKWSLNNTNNTNTNTNSNNTHTHKHSQQQQHTHTHKHSTTQSKNETKQQQQHTHTLFVCGNLANFMRAKPLVIEIYLLNRKIAVRPPEKQWSYKPILSLIVFEYFKNFDRQRKVRWPILPHTCVYNMIMSV